MKKLLFLFLITIIATGAGLSAESKKIDLIKPLEKFKSIINKTWSSKFKDPKSGKSMVDVQRWDRALNGTAIRVFHSLNNGEYGGETIITWDQTEKTIIYHYFTTAGFMTRGKMKTEGRKVIFTEKVKGNAGGITEVKGIFELLDKSSMNMESHFLKDGKWVKQMKVTYIETPEAKVVFK